MVESLLFRRKHFKKSKILKCYMNLAFFTLLKLITEGLVHIMQGHQNPVQFIISDPYWGVLERDEKSSPCINLEIGSQISDRNYIIKKSQPLSYSTVII